MSVTLELKTRRSPEPGRPFVDREDELKLIQDKLAVGLEGGAMPLVVTCFWGAFGMGKSWLLGKLEQEHRLECTGVPSGGSRPSIVARLDLNRQIVPALWKDGELERERIIRELWRQLASQIGITVPDLGQVSADEWADAFVKEATAWSVQSFTPLIMLDTVDDLLTFDEPTFFWLEEHLVERLALTERVLFVFTSRGELRRWKRFQVRRRVDSHKLKAFDAQTAGEEVGASTTVSEVLYRHAFGHPLVTEYLGTALEGHGITLKETVRVEQVIEPSLMQDILTHVVNDVLKAVPEGLANLARPASVLRWVSVEPLRALAESLGLVERDRGDAYYLDVLISGLQGHHLLYWNSVRNCYEPDPVLRRLMAYSLELDEPDLFCDAHQAAFGFHSHHLNKYPQYLARYVPELAYHRTILARCEKVKPEIPAFRTWWERFLAEKRPTHPEPWKELMEVLRRDSELQDVVPAGDYQYLHSEAQRRASGTAG